MPEYLLDAEAVAWSGIHHLRVVEMLVDQRAEPEKARELRAAGWDDYEIADALWGEIPPERCTQERLDARARRVDQLAAESYTWDRDHYCRGCIRWSAKGGRPRPSRPFAASPGGQDGGCAGCILSYLDDLDELRQLELDAAGEELRELLAKKRFELEQLLAMPTSERMMPDLREREHKLRRYVRDLQEACWPSDEARARAGLLKPRRKKR